MMSGQMLFTCKRTPANKKPNNVAFIICSTFSLSGMPINKKCVMCPKPNNTEGMRTAYHLPSGSKARSSSPLDSASSLSAVRKKAKYNWTINPGGTSTVPNQARNMRARASGPASVQAHNCFELC